MQTITVPLPVCPGPLWAILPLNLTIILTRNPGYDAAGVEVTKVTKASFGIIDYASARTVVHRALFDHSPAYVVTKESLMRRL